MKNEKLNKYIRVTSIDGSNFYINRGDVVNYALEKMFISYVILCFLIFALINNRHDLIIETDNHFLSIWAIIGITISIWFAIVFSAISILAAKNVLNNVFTALFLLPVVPLTEAATYISGIIEYNLFDVFSDIHLIAITKYSLAILCFDIVHSRFVAPMHPLAHYPGGRNADTPPSQTAARMNRLQEATIPQPVDERALEPAIAAVEQPVEATVDGPVEEPTERGNSGDGAQRVRIGNRRINPRCLQWIHTEDHYLKLKLNDESLMVRAKLSDAEDVLDPSFGFRVSRSAWVSFSAIEGVEELASGQVGLRLKDGSEFTVPRIRKLLFMQNFKLFSDGFSVFPPS